MRNFLCAVLGHWGIDFCFVNMGGHWHLILPRDRKNRPQELRVGRHGDADHVCSWCCGKSSVSDIINDNIYLIFCAIQQRFMHGNIIPCMTIHLSCRNGNYL